jgi:hypothetical protein
MSPKIAVRSVKSTHDHIVEVGTNANLELFSFSAHNRSAKRDIFVLHQQGRGHTGARRLSRSMYRRSEALV